MIDFATTPVSVPVAVIDMMDERDEFMVCVYCDCEVDCDSIVCGSCREYDGLMTVSDWEDYTGETWEM